MSKNNNHRGNGRRIRWWRKLLILRENTPTYEVRVKTKDKGDGRYSPFFCTNVYDNQQVEILHITGNKRKIVAKRAKKHGSLLSIRKIDKDAARQSIEQLDLSKPSGFTSEYINAISMEEMIWQRRKKRSGNHRNNGD